MYAIQIMHQFFSILFSLCTSKLIIVTGHTSVHHSTIYKKWTFYCIKPVIKYPNVFFFYFD